VLEHLFRMITCPSAATLVAIAVSSNSVSRQYGTGAQTRHNLDGNRLLAGLFLAFSPASDHLRSHRGLIFIRKNQSRA
jgi:hypothetical protein